MYREELENLTHLEDTIQVKTQVLMAHKDKIAMCACVRVVTEENAPNAGRMLAMLLILNTLLAKQDPSTHSWSNYQDSCHETLMAGFDPEYDTHRQFCWMLHKCHPFSPLHISLSTLLSPLHSPLSAPLFTLSPLPLPLPLLL